MLEHGGNLVTAARQYGIPLDDWLDLSTGINPSGYPVPTIQASLWQRLPQGDDGLREAAARYYGTPHVLPCAGTQAVLQVLPKLRAPCRVAIPTPTYAEHPKAWEAAGHSITRFNPADADQQVTETDVLLLCHPNNPTGQRYDRATLQGWLDVLSKKGGWLIVDEAFLDTDPAQSLAPLAGQPGLIVLRSLGKFFGMAGARVGFLIAWQALRDEAEELLGPWPISGPARYAARCALEDAVWQSTTRTRLEQDATRLARLLQQHGLPVAGGTSLYQWVKTERAEALHVQLARQGILTRLFRAPLSLRFGLPGTEPDWQRLESALAPLTQA